MASICVNTCNWALDCASEKTFSKQINLSHTYVLIINGPGWHIFWTLMFILTLY